MGEINKVEFKNGITIELQEQGPDYPTDRASRWLEGFNQRFEAELARHPAPKEKKVVYNYTSGIFKAYRDGFSQYRQGHLRKKLLKTIQRAEIRKR